MKKILLGCFCFSGLYLSAQNQQFVVVERNQMSRKSKEESMPRRMVDLNQVFKFDPLRMAIGEINFSYERVIDQQSSLEIELGPTVSNLGRNRFGFSQNGNTQFKINSGLGVVASLAYRFYPLDGRSALNQLYISPKFKYRRYNESIEGIGGSTLGSKRGSIDESIFTFNFGYQQWLADRFSFDYYFGVGLGSYNKRGFSATSEYDGVTMTYNEVWTPQSNNYTHFVATIGIKVGIGK